MSAGTQTAPREHSSKGARDRGAQPSGSGERAACSAAASPAPALGCQPASHGGDIRPRPPRPLPTAGEDSSTRGRGVGAGKPAAGKKPQPLGKAGGPGGLPSAARWFSPERARGGRRSEAGLGWSERGDIPPGLSQTRADPSSPVPSQETGTYHSLGQVRPRYQPPRPPPRSLAPSSPAPSPS